MYPLLIQSAVQIANKLKKVTKPCVAVDYNLTMDGVNRADQALVCYPITWIVTTWIGLSDNTVKKYHVTIFHHLLDMKIYNIFVLEKKHFPKADNNDFRINLVQRTIEKF